MIWEQQSVYYDGKEIYQIKTVEPHSKSDSIQITKNNLKQHQKYLKHMDSPQDNRHEKGGRPIATRLRSARSGGA